MPATGFPELGEHKEVRLGAGTIGYHERGEGPVLLFVHGVFANAALWSKVVPLLAGRFRCIAPDWPMGAHVTPMSPDADLTPRGHAAIVAEFCAALDLEQPTIVANDSGGAVTQILVAGHPELPGRLVLTNCDSHENFFPLLFKYLKAVAFVPGLTMLVAQTQRSRLVRNSPMAFGKLVKHGMPDDVARAFVKPLLGSAEIRRDAVKFLRGVNKRDTIAAAEQFGRFTRPVLLAWGADDTAVFPIRYAERMAREFPDAKVVPIPDSYSFVALDQPERLADAISA
jgi:pimeloyl-ACP methyl ester carboxylesterase